jgi:7-carboxy-7-deazaguanine synthase
MTINQNTLNLIEIFASVQGETSLTGLPTTFIRTAACNLRCSWCDTTYSFGRGEPYSLDAIIEKAESNSCRHICITGGEPLLQDNIYPLMSRLCNKGYTLSLETGGSLSTEKVDPRVRVILDIKCPYSKMSEKNYWPNLELLRDHDEIKFVIQGIDDYNYAKDISIKYNLYQRKNPILLSPVHGILDPKDLINWILRDKVPARLNVQIHKYIWTPKTRGV